LTHRILVVDDDQHIREVICVALRKAGMVPREARDGRKRCRALPATTLN
jgi:two-component system OmpR family response regulator